MNNYRWFFELALVLAAGSWWVCRALPTKYGRFLVPKAVWLYFLIHATVTNLWPHWAPEGIHPDLAVRIQKSAAQISWALTIYVPLTWTLSDTKRDLKLFTVLGWLLVADLAWMVISGYGFLFTWPSFETAMAALVLPFLYHEQKKSTWVLAGFLIGFILHFHGATGIVAAGVGLTAYMLANRMWWASALPVAVYLSIAFLLHGPTTSGRVEAWKVYMGWWETFANPLVGYGTGSAEWIIPFLPWRPDASSPTQTMNLMHNDWLQIVFDTGLLGLLASLSLATWLFRRLWARPQYFACAASYSVVMFTYFPLHYAIGQVIVCILISEAL